MFSERGTLFESSLEALRFNWLHWTLAHFGLFLLPFLAGVLGLFCLRSHVESLGFLQVTYILGYFSISVGSSLVLTGLWNLLNLLAFTLNHQSSLNDLPVFLPLPFNNFGIDLGAAAPPFTLLVHVPAPNEPDLR